MSKTSEQWRVIYKARNERRRKYSRQERKDNRIMGRLLSERKWEGWGKYMEQLEKNSD